MRKLHIAVDMDDVIVAFWPRVVQCYNTEYGADINPAKQSWDDNEIKNSPHFGPGKAYGDWWSWWRDRHWLWATCKAIPGAIGGLSQLRAAGHFVELLTHKPDWARRETTAWLAKWHPSFDRLTFVPLDASKAEASTADVLVDDKPENIQQWIDSGRFAILFAQPWNYNTSFSAPDGSTLPQWADTWDDVLRLVEAYAWQT